MTSKHLFLHVLFLSITFHSFSQTVGWFYSNAGATPGYILFAPNNSDTTYLIDKCGKRIHEWGSHYHPGQAVYFLEDGTLLHTGDANGQFNAGGKGGIVEKLDWDGNVLWSYQISDANQCQHHDAIQLPNGNILAIVWEKLTKDEAINNGRNPNNIGTSIWSDKLVEIQPSGTNSGTIVWQWRAFEHLIQDYDSTKLNYGVIADHPELLDINLGQLNNNNYDWLHCNGIDYNASLDEIVISCHNQNEVWIIDHSTTMTEATSHSGGNSGHGGDFLYRWGNPINYGRGTTSDEKFYGQHNVHWIPEGYPHAGDIMVFNNGLNRPGGNYSTVETFTPPAVENYNYPLDNGTSYAPEAQNWIYTADPANSFYSQVISGAQRLLNGNTIICEGMTGTFFEVDSAGNSLWQYINPVGANGIATQGNQAFMNSAFRCVYLSEDYPGLDGHALTPGAPIENSPLNYSCTNITGIENIIAEPGNLNVYPNPFHNEFNLNIQFSSANTQLQIHDLTGRLLYEENGISLQSFSDKTIALPDYHGMVIISLKDPSGNRIWNATAIAQ